MAQVGNLSAAETLSDLNKIISKCKKCSLYKTKNTDIFGAGPSGAKIMFIGEAPGKTEDIEGRPFVGSAGKFLTEMLKEIKIPRNEVYITNVLKHRPPENRDPKPEEIKVCWPHILKEIEIIKPLLIVLLGKHALNCFFPEMKISNAHGRAFRKNWGKENAGQVFLTLYHPAAALYNGSMRETLKNDFKKIPKLLNKIKK